MFRQRIRIRLEGDVGDIEPIDLHDDLIRLRLHNQNTVTPRKKSSTKSYVNILPDPALNDVFIGENLSSRVSYYEIQCDDGEMVKQKSSGVIVCTETVKVGLKE
ncbi:unnamed protein product [Gongylonema pulchrum]|uniref:Cadherin domain-containing protein n=1 Tax=Gongylonema pulchrum TaxID=637853 RepID=A0A183D2L2_9BILA|nr:unnamed protein product [Gongylonema pulchrum]